LPLQHCRDPPLISGAEPGNLDVQRVARDLQDRDALLAGDEVFDLIFPGVGLVPRLLLRSDEHALVAIGNPNVKGLLGKDARTFKDPTGDVYGPRLYDAAKEGQVNEVSYNSPKAGSDKAWVPKVSLVAAVAGLGCGVGYYK
jgi:hypothetical protein